jgi:Cu+-exporting ATPase
MEPPSTPIDPAPGVAIDPVCGMRVAIEGAQHTSEHQGTIYYFCAKGCRLDFEEDPGRFLAPGYRPSMGGH